MVCNLVNPDHGSLVRPHHCLFLLCQNHPVEAIEQAQFIAAVLFCLFHFCWRSYRYYATGGVSRVSRPTLQESEGCLSFSIPVFRG